MMTIPRPPHPDQPIDVPARLSAMQAQIDALRADVAALSDDRRGIVAQLASLTVEVERMQQAGSEHRSSASPTRPSQRS